MRKALPEKGRSREAILATTEHQRRTAFVRALAHANEEPGRLAALQRRAERHRPAIGPDQPVVVPPQFHFQAATFLVR